MKKISLILLTILLLVGCTKEKKTEVFSLDEELYNNASIIEIDSSEFKELEKNKNNFAVFVHLSGCTSCSEFRKVLDSFTTENNMTLYSIEYKEMKKTSIYKFVEYAPSLILYKDGEMVKYLDSVSDEDLPFYEDVESFKKWFSKYVRMNYQK